MVAAQDWKPGYREGPSPGVAGEDRRDEPHKNQGGMGDLPDAEMGLMGGWDGVDGVRIGVLISRSFVDRVGK